MQYIIGLGLLVLAIDYLLKQGVDYANLRNKFFLLFKNKPALVKIKDVKEEENYIIPKNGNSPFYYTFLMFRSSEMSSKYLDFLILKYELDFVKDYLKKFDAPAVDDDYIISLKKAYDIRYSHTLTKRNLNAFNYLSSFASFVLKSL